jgi:CDP-glucose 4,6-dehydratase
MMNPEFWQGKRVLITGHTGFKGSWLSLWLQLLQAEVLGFALPPATKPSLFNLAGIEAGMTSVLGNVCDLELLQKTLRDFQPEIVLHMAAQPLVRKSYQYPVETFATNVMGTVHLLEAARAVPSVRAVVCITSDKCYRNREWVWGYREDEPVGGYDPYSSSKGCAELAVSAYRNSFFNPEDPNNSVAVASARAGNVIGGGDWSEDRLIPDVLQCLMENRTLMMRNPQATRPWQHVLEPLNGYLTLAERLYAEGQTYSEAWNFGPYESNAKPVSWIVKQLVTLWGSELDWQLDQGNHPHEDTYLKLDCSKAHARLNWRPKLDVSSALSWIVDWTQAYQEGGDMRLVTENQIQQFMAMPPLEQSWGYMEAGNRSLRVLHNPARRETTTADQSLSLVE